MAEFNAYLKFNGNGREAMSFYQDCFGGDLNVMTIGESPVKDQMPVEMHDKIMHALLNSGNIKIMGSELADKYGFSWLLQYGEG